jgi:hypothetical protein
VLYIYQCGGGGGGGGAGGGEGYNCEGRGAARLGEIFSQHDRHLCSCYVTLLIHKYTDVRTLAQRSLHNAFLRADAVSVGLGTGTCEAVIGSATRR